MSNKFSRHLGGGPNLELIVDPKGKIVAMRDWANPRLMRADLEQLVGKAKTLTTVAQLGLPEYVPVEDPRRGVLPRLKVPGALVPIQTKTEFSKQPFYAKLRAEAGKGLLKTGNGQLYLGLHIDPIYKVHWNNVAPPVEITIQHKKTTQVRPSRYKFPKLEVKADVDPRELMVKVKGFSKGKPLKVKATYYPCDDKNTWCKKISQSYKIFPKAAKAGGKVFTRGSAAKPRQYTTPDWETFWTLDQNGDGIVAREEVKTDGQIRMFNKIDLDFDGRASRDEASRYNKELERQKRPRSTQRHR